MNPTSHITGLEAQPAEGLGRGTPGIAPASTGMGMGRRFRADSASYRWRQYGIVSYFGTFVDEDGNETPRRYQVVAIDTIHPISGRRIRMTLVKSPSFHCMPNEVALSMADKIAKDYGMRREGAEYTSSGLGVYARYLSERTEAVEVGDPVAIGFQMKNSVDGTASHMYMGYTLRLACENGMVVPGGATTIRVRATDPVEVEEAVRARLEPVLDALREEIDTYRAWTSIKLNMRLANMLAATLPKKYLSFIKFEGKTKAVMGFEPITVWQAFNRITDPLTHRRIEARHRDWLRIRLRRTLNFWQAVEEGRMDDEEAMRRIGARGDEE